MTAAVNRGHVGTPSTGEAGRPQAPSGNPTTGSSSADAPGAVEGLLNREEGMDGPG